MPAQSFPGIFSKILIRTIISAMATGTISKNGSNGKSEWPQQRNAPDQEKI
jgi:hypothetical protein